MALRKKERLEKKKKIIRRPLFTSGVNCFTNESKENRDRKWTLNDICYYTTAHAWCVVN